MKHLLRLILLTLLFNATVAFSQTSKKMENTTPIEQEILDLSLEKFKWKTTGQIDKVENLFDDELVFIHLTGQTTSKAEWIKQMKSKQFIYNKIEQKEASVKVYGNTAVLVGKAKFTVNGGSVYNLIYTEVYTQKNNEWKLVNLHTTSGY